ncbi:MalY/PatB family protein [Peptoniphilus catoniae]|uniref:MalY/PatB family protein n=1 Tax=Peptoniphilus catoniae TaxID=1660341 RepID=UPI0010FD4753|nr:MalY/PatB family protein [Peptoniphilus catoniae]
MRYDFESKLNRVGKGSPKWDRMVKKRPELSTGEVVPLSVADMEFPIAPEIREGLKEYLDQNVLGYTEANDPFFEALISWMKRRHDFDVKREWIINTPGVVPAIYAAINKFSNKGDGVIVMPPVYYPFFSAIELQNRKLVRCPLIKKERYEIDFELLEELASKEENKILLFCSPHNPVGRVWEKEELEKIAQIVEKNNLIMLCDEIHMDFVYKGHKHTVFQTINDKVAEKTITFTAPSKTFNLAGMMLSNVIVKNKDLREKLTDSLEAMSISTCTALGYKACEIAYNECEDWFDKCLDVIDENQKLVKDFFESKHPDIKAPLLEGTYLQWVDFNSLGMSNEKLEDFMKNKAGLFLDEGYIFGKEGSGFERINLAAPKSTIKESLDRLDKALKDLRG